MSSSKEYLEFVLEQLSGLEDITYRPMMGEYLLYYQGKIFGGVYDDRFLIKPTAAAKRLLPAAAEELPYKGAKPMLLVDEIENKAFLAELVAGVAKELPAPKKKK